MNLENTYASLPSKFYVDSTPQAFSKPQLLAFNERLADELGICLKECSNDELAQIFSGQKILEGSRVISMVYAAHQFGHFAGRLGDGRAMLLGEVVSPQGKRFDIQLKGSGPTVYSRSGDGLSALGSVIREYIVSEAMHYLGVPTTRALAAVITGDMVYRQQALAGGVLTRVASSHIRIGTFQYFATTGDIEGLETLLHYTINRHYPQINQSDEDKHPAILFLSAVIKAQASLVAHWSGYGFIHGVMNTDNTTVSGETIDFGPCAFMDVYQFDKVFSSIDRDGRYAYNKQSSICGWNLCRLADCLIPLVDEDSEKAIEKLNEELAKLPDIFESAWRKKMIRKFGLQATAEGKDDETLITKFLEYLEKEKLDFTLSFRHLSNLLEDGSQESSMPETDELKAFLTLWRARLKKELGSHFEIKENMNKVNPRYIPRNHQVEKAIQAAMEGDFSVFYEMNTVLKNPFTYQSELDRYSFPPRPEEKIEATFCGT